MWQKLGTLCFWLTWPGIWLLVRRTTRTRLLLRVGDEILVTRTWLSDGRWSLPGGGLHRGETPLDGVIRETREETGIILTPEDIRPLTTAAFRYHGLSFQCHYFAAEMATKPDLKLQKFEISGSRWVKLDQVGPAQCGPDVIEAIKAIGASAVG
jgi:8-oxo-dGTP pyrophosphatase MutT (NUDIX family)